MTDKDLIEKAKNLHALIYELDCFGSHDIYEYDATLSELKERGYEISTTSVLSIEKIEEDDN